MELEPSGSTASITFLPRPFLLIEFQRYLSRSGAVDGGGGSGGRGGAEGRGGEDLSGRRGGEARGGGERGGAQSVVEDGHLPTERRVQLLTKNPNNVGFLVTSFSAIHFRVISYRTIQNLHPGNIKKIAPSINLP